MALCLSHVSYLYEAGTPMEAVGLKDVSLEIRPGEFLGLIGPTGSGKSTLIQHLNGLLKPTSGNISYNGEDIFADAYNRRALRGRVGLVFQYPEHQLFEADVFSDICFGPKNQGLDAESIKARAREAMDTVGLGPDYDSRSPFELSGGEKRRVAIAGVLAMQPEIMVLDEPTAGLDPEGRRELLECLKRLQQEKGLGIVLVSHSMEDIAAFADRVAVLRRGELVLSGTPREIFRDRDAVEAAGLEIPEISRLMYILKEKNFPVDTGILTMDEAEEEIFNLFSSMTF